MREIMELFCASVNRPTMFLVLASVATPKVLINVFYPEYGPLTLVKTQIICVLYPPTILR